MEAKMKTISHIEAESGSSARAAIAAALLAGSIAGLAITILIQGNESAGAEELVFADSAASMPKGPSLPSRASVELGHFAFGYLEFDWNPTAADGVSGFDSWPPGSRR